MIYKGLFSNIDDALICCLIADDNTTKTELDTYLSNVIDLHNNTGSDDDFANQFEALSGTNLTMGETPVTISQNSDDNVLPTIKTLSCTITIVASDLHESLYTPNNQGVKCYVYNITNANYLFFGYATPCAYNQGWAKAFDELEIEFISPIATLKNVTYDFINAGTPNVHTCGAIIGNCLSKCNYYQYFDFPKIYKIDDAVNVTDIVTNMYLNEQNFAEKDKDNWTCYDVLDEFCRFMGLTLTEWGNSNRCGFFDMYANGQQYEGGNTIYYNRYNLSGLVADTDKTHTSTNTLGASQVASDDTNISIADTYNKVTVTTDFKSTDDLANVLEDNLTPYYENTILNDITTGEEFHTAQALIQNAFGSGADLFGIYKGLWAMFIPSTEGTDRKFYVWARYYHNDENTLCYWYNKPSNGSTYPTAISEPSGDFGIDPTAICNYNGACIMEADSNTVEYDNGFFKLVNGVSLTKYIALSAHRASNQNVCACYDVSMGGTTQSYKVSLDGQTPTCPLFTYIDTFKESTSANKYLVLDFNAVYSNKDTRPFLYDDFNDSDDTQKWANFIWVMIKVGDYYLTRVSNGYRCAYVGASKRVGDATYTWSTNYTAPTATEQPNHCKLFFEDTNDYIGKTMTLSSNIDWRFGIKANSGVAFLLPDGVTNGDTIQITFYTPHSLNENNASAYVFIKNLSVEIQEATFDSFNVEKEDSEIKYTNTENEPFPNALDEIEIKFHTQVNNKSESYGSILKKVSGTNTFISNITNTYIGTKQKQENNLIDEIYNTVHTPKDIINTTIEGVDVKPWAMYQVTMNLNKNMMVSSWEADIRQNTTQITVREI